MKKIGLFGGTFNPIHFGHLRAAEEIYEIFALQKVIFIPAADPPHKKRENIIPASWRARMVKLAIADNPRFSLSLVELRRKGKSYSVETIAHFRRRFGQKVQLYFIVGRDAFLEINTWKDYPTLFQLCNFAIMARPGFKKNFSVDHLPVELKNSFCYDKKQRGFIHESGFGVFPREITGLDISSTIIREKIAQGQSIKYLLPAAVEDFIYRHKLYQQEKDKR
ncbi:MAG: nicotinate-nucleotide adenylyltransferase [Thermodesulfobacteriota bacterium]